ncbi:unnamed protein product [Urochloa decumbens]|uniref:Uncharacterized protein n=1 Tax=Urochloa decumbens TaxID=240449 RepID=A0ABC8Y0C7_9POAL
MAGAGAVGVWLEVFAKIGRAEAAHAGGAEAIARRHQAGGDIDGGVGAAERGKKSVVGVQEKRRRDSGVLSESDSVVCMLMDRFAPA